MLENLYNMEVLFNYYFKTFYVYKKIWRKYLAFRQLHLDFFLLAFLYLKSLFQRLNYAGKDNQLRPNF